MTTASERPGIASAQVEEALRFLRLILPERTDDERYRFEVFGPKAPAIRDPRAKNYLDLTKLAETLVRHGQVCDAYVAVATFPANSDNRRAESALRVAAIWQDLDVGPSKPHETKQAALAALEAFPLPPTAIVDSGNGIHVYWCLDTPTEDLDRVTAIVNGLATVLPGDAQVALKSQVMRVPGTFNHKRAPLPVRLLSVDEENTYSLDAFADAGVPEIPVGPQGAEYGERIETGDISHLPVGARGWQFIAVGAPMGAQRREAVAVARSLLGAGYTVDETATYVWKGLQAGENDPTNPWTFDDAYAIARDLASRPAPPLARGDRGGVGDVGPLVAPRPRQTTGASASLPGEDEIDPAALAAGDYGEFPLTDAGNAELFALEHGAKVRFDHKRSRWLIFGGHHWREDVDGELSRLAIETARLRRRVASHTKDDDQAKATFKWALTSEGRARLDAMLELAKSQPPIADRGEGWDADPDLLGVANGVVDLATGDLRAGRPEDRITLSAPVAYSTDATAPTWERALAAMMEGDEDLLAFLQVACGYSLTGHTREQVLFLAFGSGANGKSTFLNVIRAAVGQLGHNLPFTALEQAARQQIPADIAQLPGKRLVTSSETSDSSRLYESRIKALTGSDPITAAEKFKAPFTFQPVAKLWLATNHLPQVRDDSHGFWRRMRVIPFRHQFAGEELDPTLEARLLEELPGVLRWMVQGAVKWHQEGLRAPESVLLATEAYRVDSDPIADFIEERCLVAEVAQTGASDLYKTYLGWANEAGLGKETMTPTMFGRRMSERFEKVHTKTGKVYRGIGIAFPGDGSPLSGDGFAVQFDSLATSDGDRFDSASNPSPRYDSQSRAVTGDGFEGRFAKVHSSIPHVGGDLENGSPLVTPSRGCVDCGVGVPGGFVRCHDCAALAARDAGSPPAKGATRW